MRSQFVFGATPTVKMRRSRFDLSHGVKTTMRVGKLTPIEVNEVFAGDTFKIRESHVAQLATAFLRPVMDNCYLDLYYFFVPARLLYEDFPCVFGENKQSKWANVRDFEVPTFPVEGDGAGKVVSKTVADYLGLPLGVSPNGASILPFRGFAMIYDEWFRNENTVDPMMIQKGDFNGEALNDNEWSPSNYTGRLPNVSKRKDYFTSCLPSPQKGKSVDISLGIVEGTYAPVLARQQATPKGPFYNTRLITSTNQVPADGSAITVRNSFMKALSANLSGAESSIAFDNLWANISDAPVTPTNINDLRMAFQVQKMLEKDARYGTRYREYLLGHFGVDNTDARMQIPEYLGGKRTPISVQPVAQTNTQQKDSEGSVESPLASLGAFSHSVGRSRSSKSFTEHGYVYTVACIRQFHTYQQGIDKMWFRRKRLDFYDPVFANIGEQPVLTDQLYRDPDSTSDIHDSDPFGYQEAWTELRFKSSLITGEMRNDAPNSFAVYHFGDYYQSPPVLTKEFTDETSQFFDRTIAAPGDEVDEFLVDFWFDFYAYRVMPLYSVPGLIDHH